MEANREVETKKLDKWAELLLDTGKRNSQIKFNDRRALTAEVLFPSPDTLFRKLNDEATFEVYDPQIHDEDEMDISESEGVSQTDAPKEGSILNKKEEFLSQYAPKIKRQNQILLYKSGLNPLNAVKKIDKKARESIEETGVNVAYMAFGFIHWKEKDSSESAFCAPVLLIPIKLEQTSAVEPYHVKSAEDDIIVNPAFSFKMEAEHGVKLPDYNDEGLMPYLEEVRRRVAKLQWKVTAECKIGIFSFLKINMYRDLKDNAKKILANQNVRILLGEPIDVEKMRGDEATVNSVCDPLIELHSVVDADSSQIEAIEMAKSGRSFVLQGPPGTGKSQTITNIIAECLSDGKKVLFVSEKLAALNVVYEKLKQANLADFCLQLHSHKANKKDVIADIYHTLHAEKSSLSPKAEAEIAIKKKAEDQLNTYATELHMQRKVIGKSLYQLYEMYFSLQTMPDIQYAVPQIQVKGEAYLEETISLLEQYVEYIPSVGYDYKKNRWYGYINRDISFQTKNEVKYNFSAVIELLRRLIPLQQELSERYSIQCISIEDFNNWNAFFNFATTSKLITPALLNREHFDVVKSTLQGLQTRSADILAARTALSMVFDNDIYKIDGITCHKKLTKQFAGTFSRLFNAEYKKIIAELRLCKKDGKKPSYSEAVNLLKQLADFQEKITEYTEAESAIKGFLGEAYNGVDTKWGYVTEQVSVLEEIFTHNTNLGLIGNYEDFVSERNNFAGYYQKIEEAFSVCERETLKCVSGYFDPKILNIRSTPCAFLANRLAACLEEMDKMENWYHFSKLLSELENRQVVSYIDEAIRQNIEPKYIARTFQKQFVLQWIDLILSGNPALSMFNRISQDKAIRTFSEKDKEQFAINRAKIRAFLSSQRPDNSIAVPGSPLSILNRQGERKRNQKSIRSLLAETGELVQRVKPCFLMSPLSVSTFLDPESIHFDVVIFDEASQIFPQDAIGAIYRAEQLIVVGDSKQMPPSNFFNTTLEVQDGDEETGDVTDFESILDLCSASMQKCRLRWHYRSRYEQLIAFSNKNFYDNDLVTFPSSKADSLGTGVDYYHVNGTFDRKAHVNRKEAEFVVDLIYKNIKEYPNRSLGVVAFSCAQQDLIDKLLSQKRQSAPEKEFFFRKDGTEPFFIKNLETVQGDERDTIIFSIAYGRDTQGRFLHNFGPLNHAGGERRLNVAVTRAKCNVQLVSSMHYTDIELKHTSVPGVKLLREYLDYAENGSIALERTISIAPFEQFDSDFELEVCDYLRSKGFSVDTQVGCSGFRIDLGLKLPDSSDYVLAIECDGATYHSSKNARDRDRLRQEILERMGWKFYRIWSTDWFRNKSVEQSRLLEAVSNAVKNPVRAEKKTAGNQHIAKFEEVAAEKHFEFPLYQEADIGKISGQYLPRDFKGMIRAILQVEAPLSEDLLLKRIVWCFDSTNVTKSVRESYERQMYGCRDYGITRKKGFLYLDCKKDIQFRAPGSMKRDIKQIAPEELAAGMLEILKQNVTAEKSGLYRSLAAKCGFTRVGKNVNEAMDSALNALKDQIVIEGNRISIK